MRTKLFTLSIAFAALAAVSAVADAQSFGRISPYGQSVSTRSATDRLVEEKEKADITIFGTEKATPEEQERAEKANAWKWLVVPVVGHSPSDQLGGVTAVLGNAKNEFNLGYTYIDLDGAGSLDNVTALYKRVLYATKDSPFELAAELSYDTVESTADTTSLTLAGAYAIGDVVSATLNVGYTSADIDAAGTIDDFTTTAGLQFALGKSFGLTVDRRLKSDLGDARNSAGLSYSHTRDGEWLWDLTFKGYPGDAYIAYAVFPL